MTPVGIKSLEWLVSRGAGAGLRLLLSPRPEIDLPPEHPLEKLFAHERLSGDPSHSDWESVEFMDTALQSVVSLPEEFAPWRSTRLETAWSPDSSASQGALTELEALGTIRAAFPNCVPIAESRTSQTPDFFVDGQFCAEAYCPRESDQNQKQVADDLARQTGIVRIAISHPHTGSSGESLRYPASKIIDRFLNAKRGSKQVRKDSANVLYVDARREWKLASTDVLPFRTKYSLETHWIGTFGVWHAFYGSKGRHALLHDRVSLQYLRSTDAHEQKTAGLFRDATMWSASIIALTDGIVLFENPWAHVPLPEHTLRQMLHLHRFRAEFSWHRVRSLRDLEGEVELTLHKLEWIFQHPCDLEETSSGDA